MLLYLTLLVPLQTRVNNGSINLEFESLARAKEVMKVEVRKLGNICSLRSRLKHSLCTVQCVPYEEMSPTTSVCLSFWGMVVCSVVVV